jgi:hypothetical protein
VDGAGSSEPRAPAESSRVGQDSGRLRTSANGCDQQSAGIPGTSPDKTGQGRRPPLTPPSGGNNLLGEDAAQDGSRETTGDSGCQRTARGKVSTWGLNGKPVRMLVFQGCCSPPD